MDPHPARRLLTWAALVLIATTLVDQCAASWAGDGLFRGSSDAVKTDKTDRLYDIKCSRNISCDSLHIRHWDRATCKANITTLLEENPSFSRRYNTPEYFMLGADGKLANGDHMTLTLRGCNELCGGWTWYWDAGPRLTTWVIPVVLLLSNIELTPIDKRRFMTVAHAVGDPIDSFWSILHKIYIWRRLYAIGLSKCGESNGGGWAALLMRLWKRVRAWVRGRRRRGGSRTTNYDTVGTTQVHSQEDDYDQPHDRARVIATVLAGFEEIGGAQTTSELHYHMLLTRLGNIGNARQQSPGAWHEWRRCARELADARTNEIPRTLLAILIYVFGVVAALYDEIGGGNTSKPGGRIGSAVFLMWLVPLALLSNTVGTFPSRRTCIAIMRVFVDRARAAMKEEQEAEQRRQQDHIQRTGSGSRTSDASLVAPAMSLGSPALSPNISSSGEASSPVLVQSVPPTPQSPPLTRQDAGRPRNTSQPSPLTASSLLQRQTYNVQGHGRRASREAHRRRTRSDDIRASPNTPEITISESQEPVQTETSRSPGRPGTRTARRSNQAPSTTRRESLEMRTSPTHSRSPSSRRYSPAEIGSVTPDAGDRRRSDSIDIVPEQSSRRRTSSSAPLLGSPEFDALRWTAANDSAIIEESPTLRDTNTGTSARDTADEVHIIPSGSWDVYFSWLQPLGGIYTYRPWKINYRSVSVKSHAYYTSNWLLYCFSLFPVVVSVVGAFVIIWFAVPVGWSCRHVWVVGVSVLWLLTTAVTVSLHKWQKSLRLTGRSLWVLVVVKDGVIGLGSLALVFFSTAGMFNSCYCWSAYMWHHFLPGNWGKGAHIPLNAGDLYDEYADKIYSRVVFGSLGAQFVFFFFICFLWWDGLYVVRWSEDRCRREWRHEISGGSHDITYGEDTKLLFWYSKRELEEEDRALLQRRATFTAEEMVRRQSRSSIVGSIRSPFLRGNS